MKNDQLLTSTVDVRNHLEALNQSDFTEVVKNIQPGSYPRDATNPGYKDRLAYTQELRKFVYNPAILNLVFSDVKLKKLFFRTFGYQGQLDFTIYPDCWLRDLPLIDIGEGVYLGDGIVLGTNQVSVDQKMVTVGSIKIGRNSIFDQRCAIGYGTTISTDCVVGFQVAIGLRCTIGQQVKIGGYSGIEHRVQIGDQVRIGSSSKIGSFVIIDDQVQLPEFSLIPSYSHVTKIGIVNRRKET